MIAMSVSAGRASGPKLHTLTVHAWTEQAGTQRFIVGQCEEHDVGCQSPIGAGLEGWAHEMQRVLAGSLAMAEEIEAETWPAFAPFTGIVPLESVAYRFVVEAWRYHARVTYEPLAGIGPRGGGDWDWSPPKKQEEVTYGRP